jgi:hypothetical protein
MADIQRFGMNLLGENGYQMVPMVDGNWVGYHDFEFMLRYTQRITAQYAEDNYKLRQEIEQLRTKLEINGD